MNTKTSVIALCASLLILQGCSSVQRYSASGLVSVADQSEPSAVIYWDKQVGRTWYGARLPSNPTPVQLQVCKDVMTVKRFTPLEPNQALIVRGRNGDSIKQAVDAQGELVAVDPPSSNANQGCMQLWQQDQPATIKSLETGRSPNLLVLCESINPSRYPLTGKYAFSQISKTAIDSDNKPDACQ